MEEKKMEIVEQKSTNPAEMAQALISKGMKPEDLMKLLAVQERHDANEARKAFHKAMADFKMNAPEITKDKTNNQYGSKYTSLSNLVNTVNPVLSKHGLTASWEIDQLETLIKVTCVITHELGHSEKSSMSSPPDTSGAKNNIQQIKSAITYLKGVTFESICGLASTDGNVDDDGNNAGQGEVELIDEKQLGVIKDYVDNNEGFEARLLKYLHVDSIENILKADYQKAVVAMESVK